MNGNRILRSLWLVTALLCGAGGKALAHPMWGIAVDKAGQVYFSDLKTVWRIDAAGRLSIFRPKGEEHVHEIGLDADGNLLGAENTYDPSTKKFFSGIWKMTPSGQSSYVVPLQENPPKGTSILRDSDGVAYYVTEFPTGKLLVLKRTPSGEVTAIVGDEKAVRDFRQSVPYGIGPVAFGSNGEIYFTHGSNVSRITREARFTTITRDIAKETASGKREKTALYGIAVDYKGDPIVADYGNRRVFRIAASAPTDNRIATIARSDGPWYPTGVATHGGDIYVLEVGHTPSHEPVGTRVRRLSPDGSVAVLATVGPTAANAQLVTGPEADSAATRVEGLQETKELVRTPLYVILPLGAVFATAFSIAVRRKRVRGRT